MADQLIRAGECEIVVAGGMESMTNAPHLLPKSREGFKYGDVTLRDSMAYDGLWDEFTDQAMGVLTEERNAAGANLTREEQDAFSARSHQLAAAAWKNGVFDDEVVPVEIPQRKGDPVVVGEDEGVRGDTTAESLGRAAPGLQQGRHHHRRLGLADLRRRLRGRRDEQGEGRGARPGVARRDRRPRHGRRPRLDAADPAGQRDREGAARRRASRPPTSTWSSSTRRSPPSASRRPASSASPRTKVNVNGGAIALGHPIGMSGARIVLHLALELQRRGGGVGAAALCGGGGQGDALIVRVPARPDQRERRASPATWSRGARAGEARAVARLISLVEDASPLLREVMAALAPHTGQRAGHRPHRLARGRQVDLDLRAGPRAARGRTSGSACWRSTRRRRSPAARCSATGCGCGTTPLDDDVYIRSMATRGHLGGLAWATPQALRVLDAAGCDVVLVETVGVGQSEVEVAGARRHHVVLLAPGHGRRHPGREGRASSRSATSSSSTRPTATAPTRYAATCARCSRWPSGADGAWRPPVVKTVARRARASTTLVAALDKHRAWLAASGELDAPPRPPGPRRDRGDRGDRAARAVGRPARPRRPRRAGRRGRRGRAPTPTPPPTGCWPTSVLDLERLLGR